MKPDKKIQIGIVWANPYNKNLGVAALAYASLALLSDMAEAHGIQADFSFFGSERSGFDQITIGNKSIRFRNIPGLDFYDLKWRLKLWLFPKKHRLADIRSIDYVFDIAEGDSFTDIYGEKRFKKIRNSKIYFGKRVKKQVLLPQTIGPFKDPKNEQSAFKAMRYAHLVISRDKQSYTYTANQLPANRLAESIDVAFYMPYTKKSFDESRTHIGINVSGLLWNGGYTRNNQFGMQTNYTKLIVDTLNYFSQQKDVQIHLVPHVIPEYQAVEDDYEAALVIQKQFPQVQIAPRFKTPIEAKSYISGLDFFTGARMHACIAAFSTGVPVYPMAYSRKFNGLFADTLQYPWLGDCVNTNEENVLRGLEDAYNRRQELKDKIAYCNETIVQPRLTALKELLYTTIIH
ncbi:polysaccharide pyruvyl transferase family protein [Olivibacter ginsenosidimutans]|uniref:Polysaccharide pyruvyl transferase family protein n=1 Tax=Olivibacter ginsenosidimutans TaxID=1176537 RepID=A0ABP9AHV9_9SPHI